MKRIIALILATVTLITMSACGSKDTEADTTAADNKPDTETTTGQETTDTDSPEDTTASSAGNKIDLNLNFDLDLGLDEIPSFSASEHTIELNLPEIKLDFADNVDPEDLNKFDGFSAAEIEDIVLTKAELLNNLRMAFRDFGVNVNIDEVSGEVSLDSSVLFGGDSSVLSAEGKSFLKKFIGAYASVICSDDFEGFISKVMVEGHTAPVAGSTYESGLPLSVERADTVKSFCLSSETGLSQADLDELSGYLESVGLSNSKPVTDSSGNVDMAASRRVSFRFIIDLD